MVVKRFPVVKPKYKKVAAKDTSGAPLKISIPSDGNELQLLAVNGNVFTYVYTVSKTKQGNQLTLTKEQLDKLLLTIKTIQK